ncbi:MAG: nuclear transport factor 2 family protein [Acetobacteraceae bacterium]|nr:nuclear transport factor 2 family protein [Acetobacteraceae bacterium]
MIMTIDENKQVVRAFCAHFKDARIGDLLDAMSDDATWWILGKPHLFSGAGTKSRAEMERIWGHLFRHMKDGLDMSVIGMVAEGDKVAAEIRSHADLKDGRVYENQYHMLFTLRQGKIIEVKEYADTLLIATMFG